MSNKETTEVPQEDLDELMAALDKVKALAGKSVNHCFHTHVALKTVEVHCQGLAVARFDMSAECWIVHVSGALMDLMSKAAEDFEQAHAVTTAKGGDA